MKTFSAKSHEVKREWFVIDATDKVLGRVASEVAHRLRGKHKPEFTPHVDTGDFIVIINASKLRVTGTKGLNKKYYTHSGYPGGIYETNFDKMQGFNDKHAPLRRGVTIEEVGNASAFLCSDLASGITGEITYVDGGMNITAAGVVD